jgi:hypothetical protein
VTWEFCLRNILKSEKQLKFVGWRKKLKKYLIKEIS